MNSVRQGCAALLALSAMFVLLEPAIGMGATTASSQFTISQTVTSEVAFATAPSNVTLNPSLGGLTGGTSGGGTQVIIYTNDHLGYNMTLTASSSLGMLGNTNQANTIPAYASTTAPSLVIPDYNFNTPANKAYFGYTVDASTTTDLSQLFLDNGSACNTGSSNTTGDHCWLNASSSAVSIINRSSATPNSGATTTLKFRVTINANPNPVIPDDTYVATTTLTATAN